MPRPPRIHVAGALYHTIARGNGGQRTFLDEKDYRAFVDGLGELKRKTPFSVYAYCLMPNHFHLLIETQRFPLSMIMQRLLTRYVRSFNFRHRRIGHLFQGRYKAILCQRDANLQVVHTQSVRSPDALEFTLFKNTVRKLEGSWGAALIDELKPADDEPLIVKRTHDCFYQTEMESLLKRLGIGPGESHVVVTGISTRNCIQSAVTAFSVRDYRIYMPMDCTAQRDEKEILQAFSLFTSFGYRHNVTMTRSDLIQLRPPEILR